MSLVRLLDERPQIDPCLVSDGLAFPIFEVALVKSATREEIDRVDEELLGGVWVLGQRRDLLGVGTSLE
jgi:hypothetical protein